MNQNGWKLPFEILKEKIKPLEEAGLELFHVNVMTPFHDREQAETSTKYLEPNLMGKELIEIIETPTLACRHHAHYFFGDRKALDHMKRILSELHTWMSHMPPKLLPKLLLPQMTDNTSKSVVLWSNLVYTQAWQSDRWFLSANVECQKELGSRNFVLWEHLNHPPGLDPGAVLAHQECVEYKFETWAERFDQDSCLVPEYLGAYLQDTGSGLCGEFLRASLAAIDLLFVTPIEEPRSPKTGKTTASHGRKKVRKKTDDAPKSLLTRRASVLLAVLLEVHGCNSGNPMNEPLSQDEMEDLLTKEGKPCSQGTISRAINDLMLLVSLRPQLTGMEKYVQLCADSSICDALSGIQIRSNRFLNRGLHEKYEISDEHIERHHDKRY